ncbi:aarF domain-containing protein kinase 1-like [Schistocerca gregaria]|uniref:aarF domain-containing protein kinase 1-like n=1 Tax=Schistocerca gregaria TaxID=7010 RepID=UPI00211ED5C8|nr:aarF domain-containing protein kinase 1-like [Schistocerca gregaria]
MHSWPFVKDWVRKNLKSKKKFNNSFPKFLVTQPPVRQTTSRREKASTTVLFAIKKTTRGYLLRAATGAFLATTFVAAYQKYEGRAIFLSTTRFFRSIWACTKISADYKISTLFLSGNELDKQISLIHARSAETLVGLFQRQGGIYVKCGQHMSSLTHLLPPEYCRAMSRLHSNASTRSYDVIEEVLEKELGVRPSVYFDYIDPTPVAAASIAQVHYAVVDKKPCAVKVQFPDVGELCNSDIKTIDFITRVISFIFPQFKLQWLVREFENNLPLELDFLYEAENANTMRELFKNDQYFHIPEIYSATRRTLIMEWIEGKHICDMAGLKEMNANPLAICAQLNRIFTEQIFKHRFVHCDPHPGNILVRKTERNPHKIEICLLDNGLYRRYSEDFCLDYAKLWMAILRQDEDAMAESARRMGVTDYRLFASIITARSWGSISTALYSDMDVSEVRFIKSQVIDRAIDITFILGNVPSSLLLLLKTNDLLRVINRQLGNCPVSALLATTQACQSLIRNKSDKKSGIWVFIETHWERWALRIKFWIFSWILFLRPIFVLQK